MRPFAAVEAAPRHAVRRTGILLGLVTAPASVAIGAASVALPTIASSLHGSFGSTAWVIAAWALGAAVSMPLMGRAAQRNGVRATLIAAAAMLTFGSVLAALGPSLLVIVIGRLIGGLGAGGTVISVYRYVDHVFTGAAPRRAGTLSRRQLTLNCSAAWFCGRWVKTTHATRSSTFRTVTSIAGANCGMSSPPSTTYPSQSRWR